MNAYERLELHACSAILNFDAASIHQTRVVPRHQIPYTATVKCNGCSTLPFMINSVVKVATYFYNFDPQFTGLLSADTVFVVFRDQDRLNRFINAVDGTKLPTGESLGVRRVGGRCPKSQALEAEIMEKRRLRAEKKLARAQLTVNDLGYFFPGR